MGWGEMGGYGPMGGCAGGMGCDGMACGNGCGMGGCGGDGWWDEWSAWGWGDDAYRPFGSCVACFHRVTGSVRSILGGSIEFAGLNMAWCPWAVRPLDWLQAPVEICRDV